MAPPCMFATEYLVVSIDEALPSSNKFLRDQSWAWMRMRCTGRRLLFGCDLRAEQAGIFKGITVAWAAKGIRVVTKWLFGWLDSRFKYRGSNRNNLEVHATSFSLNLIVYSADDAFRYNLEINP